MKPDTNPAKSPDAKPNANDDLQSLGMPEIQKKLGSSAKGPTQVEARKRLDQ